MNPSGPSGPSTPRSPLTAADKRYARSLHRQNIEEARAKASLCREQYDTQIRETGEVGRELYDELVASAYRFYMEVRPSFLDTEVEDDLNEMRDLFGRVFDSDKPVWEIDDLAPKVFAGMIDVLESLVEKAGLLEVDA